MTVTQSIELFFQEGQNDKVYNAQVVENGDGTYTVKVQWGRRNSPLATGTKAINVTLALAVKAYEKVIRQKTKKGYEARTTTHQPAAEAPPEGEGSASKVAGTQRTRLQQQAQLLNSTPEESLAALFSDRGFVAQQKFDGIRRLVHVGTEVVATNRSGEIAVLEPALAEAVQVFPEGTILDGEWVSVSTGPSKTCVYWLFDLLSYGAEDLRAQPYSARNEKLQAVCPVEHDLLQVVATATTAKQKRALNTSLQAGAAEGIVFKRKDAAYTAGRPPSGGTQLKYKFVKTADVFIIENAGNAYKMAVYTSEGQIHEAGKVFAGTTNESRARLDALLGEGKQPVAEVKYLYATDKNLLFQPVFVRRRTDKTPAECQLSQFLQSSRDVVVTV